MAKRNTIEVEFEGIEELRRNLERIGKRVNSRELLEDALMDGAEIVKESMQATAPRRTGQLIGSIDISKEGREQFSVRIGPTGSGFYGRFLEYGTSRVPARPFVRPGFDSVSAQTGRAVQDGIRQKVEEAAERM